MESCPTTTAQAASPIDRSRESAALLREIDLTSDRLLSFVHIPKTAGTTVYGYLDNKFLPHQVFPADRDHWHGPGMAAMRPQTIDEFRCVRGHLFARQLAPFFAATSKDILSFTVLRNPEARELSAFDMMCNDPNAAEYRLGVGGQLTFDQFLELPWFPGLAVEYPQCAHLMSRNRQTAHLLMQQVDNPFEIPENEWFERAIEQLEDYLLVGIHERLDQSVQVLSYLLGWHCHAALPVLNPARGRRHEITASQRERIRETHAIDFQLYDWALDRLQRQHAAMCNRLERRGADVGSTAGLVAAINRHGDDRIQQRVFRGALTGHDFEVIHTTGLTLGHVSRDTGRQINWIGPEPQATVRLALPAINGHSVGDRVLHIEVLYWLTQKMIDDFYVIVNGQRIPLLRQQLPESCQFVGYLPSDLLGPPGTFVELELGTSSVNTPAALGLNHEDLEQKCLALAALQCFAANVPALGR